MMRAILFPLLLCVVPASAQEEAPGVTLVAPPAEVHETVKKVVETAADGSETAPEKGLPRPSMLDDKKPEPAAEAEKKVEPAAEPEMEPEAKPELKASTAAKPTGPEEEFAFAKSAAEDADGKIQEAAMAELTVFVRRYPASEQAPEAILLLAGLKQKQGDWRPATADLLHLLYEYPDTKSALRAKSDFLTLVDKKASRRQRPILNDLVKLPATSDKADRLSSLWQKIAELAPEALYEPVVDEIREFFVRFPGHKDGDKLQAALARLHAANDKPAAALLSWRKLLALYPDSPLRPQAQMSIGDVFAGALRDPKQAIDAYQELVEKCPKAPEVLAALESSARLFEDKLRQYALAVEMHERIVKLYPKTPSSLKSLKAIAKLQRDRLKASEDAIKTLLRLSAMHGGQDGVDALLQASEYARRDLKDYQRQADILLKASNDYAAAREAPQALYDAAGVYEDSIKDNAKAIELYREVGAKFPDHKLARRGESRAVKLEGK
ncbi:MAG: hypothetical protein COV48_15810 [Elusimicrobia bacterium CG11_big_fil_rev_8_21_14_0_20_64_6]|nr:MAG: hypothetical protein COV48_15810 [Elusimicrobia bacterium CG11_big_fil_rev_8_21_14_0_20_64_6]